MRTTLGEVCSFLNGGTPSKETPEYFQGDIPWITGADIFGDRVNTARSYITSKAVAESATNKVPPGTVLLVTRTSVGKVAMAGVDLCFSQDITAVVPDSKILAPSFLMHFLRTKRNRLERFARGATIKGITRDVVSDLAIYLPSLTEQQRLASILDQAETLRVQCRQALAKLDALTRSLFLELFGDPVTNTKDWPQKFISEIGNVVTGNTPSRANPDYYGSHIEWVKSDNINTPNYYLTKADEGLSESGKAVARTVGAGSILVTCIAGSPACIGNAAMTDREVAFNQQINAFVPVEGDAHFLYGQILVGKRLIQEASTGGMKGMVSKSRFEQIKLIFPPVDLQRKFARQIVTIEKLKTARRASLEKFDTLFAALQSRAFGGDYEG